MIIIIVVSNNGNNKEQLSNNIMRNNKVDADRHGQRPPLVLPASKCPPPTAPSRYRVSLLGSPAQVSDTAGTIATGSRVLGRIAVGCGVVGVAVLCLLSGGDSQSRSALEVANIRHAFWDRPGDRVDGSRSTRADSNELSRTARGAQLNAKGLAAGDGPRHTGRGTSALGSGEQARRDHEGDVAFGGAEFFARKVNRSEALEDHGGHSGEYRGGADVTEDDPVSNVGARRRMTAAGKGGVLRGSNLDENGSSRPENDSDGDGIRRMRSSSRNTGRPTRTYTRGPRARRAVDLEVVDDRLDLSGTQVSQPTRAVAPPSPPRYLFCGFVWLPIVRRECRGSVDCSCFVPGKHSSPGRVETFADHHAAAVGARTVCGQRLHPRRDTLVTGL